MKNVFLNSLGLMFCLPPTADAKEKVVPAMNKRVYEGHVINELIAC